MLNITVLGAVLAPRDLLVSALARHQPTTGAVHRVTTQAGGDLTFLLGLNRLESLPGSASNLEDQSLRNQLNDSRQPYHVLYGTLDEKLAQAMRIIHVHLPASPNATLQTIAPQSESTPWRWTCDKCSDSACEHKLLTDLLAQRAPRR